MTDPIEELKQALANRKNYAPLDLWDHVEPLLPKLLRSIDELRARLRACESAPVPDWAEAYECEAGPLTNSLEFLAMCAQLAECERLREQMRKRAEFRRLVDGGEPVDEAKILPPSRMACRWSGSSRGGNSGK